MQIVHCQVALGGDRRNTVPKYDVTVPELVVLRAIHGEDAVYEIDPVRTVPFLYRDELDRLRGTYMAKDEENRRIVDLVFPGAAPRLPTTLGELGLGSELFTREYQNRLEAGEVLPVGPDAPAASQALAEPDEEDLPELDADPEPEFDLPPAPVAKRSRKAEASVLE